VLRFRLPVLRFRVSGCFALRSSFLSGKRSTRSQKRSIWTRKRSTRPGARYSSVKSANYVRTARIFLPVPVGIIWLAFTQTSEKFPEFAKLLLPYFTRCDFQTWPCYWSPLLGKKNKQTNTQTLTSLWDVRNELEIVSQSVGRNNSVQSLYWSTA